MKSAAILKKNSYFKIVYVKAALGDSVPLFSKDAVECFRGAASPAVMR
jgi:hypothetical protein